MDMSAANGVRTVSLEMLNDKKILKSRFKKFTPNMGMVDYAHTLRDLFLLSCSLAR